MAEAQKRKTGLMVALVAVLVVALLGLWWALKGGERGEDGEDADEVARSQVDPEDALRRKREAREAGLDIDPVEVGGRVTRAEDDKGIPGAVVLLSRKGLVQGQSPEAGQPSESLFAITDINGGWKIANVDPGGYLLSATADGYIPATRTDVRVLGSRDQLDLNLQMTEGGSRLSGTVTDIGGGPIEGVLVRLQEATGAGFGFKSAPLATMTNDEGEYALQVANGRYAITTSHADYVGNSRLTEIRDAERVEDFELVPGGTIEGVVISRASGEVVPNARVTFADSRNGDVGGFTVNMSFDGSIVTTDEDGRFRLHGLRAGVVAVNAWAPNASTPSPVEIPIGIGEQVTGVELYVDAAFTISGFVVPRGDPERSIEGVLVGAWQLQPPSLLVASAPSSADGYFEIVGVPTGVWQVGAVGEDNLLTLTGATANVVDADIENLLIELDEGVRIRGRVDPPVVARVRVRPDPENASLSNMGAMIGDGMALGTTNDKGEFELGPLGPGGGLDGRKVMLVAESDDGYRGELEVDLHGKDLEDVVIPLTKGATVAGTVLDETGAPQAGVTVSVTAADPEGDANFRMQFGAGDSDGAPTGQDGSFAVRGLETGTHLILVKDTKGRALSWADGTGPSDGADGEVQPIEIEIEDTVNDVFQNLRVVPRDGVITGVVLDGTGMPVPDAFVTAALDMDAEEFLRSRDPTRNRDRPERLEGVEPDDDDGGRDWTQSAYFAEPPVLTDENGLFVIKELRRDRAYNLVAEGERGGARATLEGVSPGERVDLVLETLGGIDGVVLAKGKPVTQYTLEAKGPVNRNSRIHDASGEFELDRLDPGTYTVTVSSDDGIATAEVELGDRAREHVELELQAWGSIEGEVVGKTDGEPMAKLAVIVSVETGRADASTGIGLLTGKGPKTGRDGRFEVGELGPGKGEVVFMDPDVDLASGAPVATVEFELEPGQSLDLGTIRGIQTDSVPTDERGTLGLRVAVSKFEDRPRPPGTDLDEEDPGAPSFGDPKASRVWVRSVDVGGVAEAAGIVPGDEVLTIDGQAVSSLGAGVAAQMLSKSRLRVGQEVRVELRRAGTDDRYDETLKALSEDGEAEAPAEPPDE